MWKISVQRVCPNVRLNETNFFLLQISPTWILSLNDSDDLITIILLKILFVHFTPAHIGNDWLTIYHWTCKLIINNNSQYLNVFHMLFAWLLFFRFAWYACANASWSKIKWKLSNVNSVLLKASNDVHEEQKRLCPFHNEICR